MKSVVNKFMEWLINETDVSEFTPEIQALIRNKLEELLTEWYRNMMSRR